MDWTPSSWRAKPARHLPTYPDGAALNAVMSDLAARPGLVSPEKVRALKAALGRVAGGKGFLLQGGDCAESFHVREGEVLATACLLGRMARMLTEAGAGEVVQVGRIAGQFAKPRTFEAERRGALELPSYRGDIVNGIGFYREERTPDPARMREGYGRAQTTLALIRPYPLYTSHEALLLPFEQALTRRDEETGAWYAASAHMLWLGYRTGDPAGAHAEFLRGIASPIGVKIGPDSRDDNTLRLLALLNPENEAGRITVICRFGRDGIARCLPLLVRRAEGEGFRVLWACDPMHGNTVRAANGLKTRRFGDIRQETLDFFAILRAEGAHPGGIHLELTGSDVTECTGGEEPVSEAMLASRYHTHCDPRLNAAQSLELAKLIAQKAGHERQARQSRPAAVALPAGL